jgi:hypothetical protein
MHVQGEPLELVRYNVETAKFEVGERATEVLRAVRGPLGVVAVCGRARQGKSFLLNQLLKVTGGFSIGSTTRPCSKGLWMWSHPQLHTTSTGSEYHLVRGRVPSICQPGSMNTSHECTRQHIGLTTLVVQSMPGGPGNRMASAL